MVFSDWLLWLSISFASFFHVTGISISLPVIVKYYSIVWTCQQIVKLFPLFVFMINDAVNICVQFIILGIPLGADGWFLKHSCGPKFPTRYIQYFYYQRKIVTKKNNPLDFNSPVCHYLPHPISHSLLNPSQTFCS